MLATTDLCVDAVAVCRVRAGRRLVGGRVAAYTVLQVVSGTLHLTVSGHDAIICGTGSIVVVPPSAGQAVAADESPLHDAAVTDHARPMHGGMVLLDAADGDAGELCVVCGLVGADAAGDFGLLGGVAAPIVAPLGDLPLIRHSGALLLADIDHGGPGARALAGALLKTGLILLLRRQLARTGRDAIGHVIGDARLGKAVAAVLDRPADGHSVASLARVAGMSRSAFAGAFTGRVAMSPMMFVARTRLHHAARLLETTTLPVGAVASAVGFASRSHFSRSFRAVYRADPSAYRGAASRTRAERGGE